MTEIVKVENVLVDKQECKSNETKIQKVYKDGEMRSGSWYLSQIKYIKQNEPCGDD